MAIAVKVWAVAKGQIAPSHSQVPVPCVLNRGLLRSAVVNPKGAENPFSSFTCSQAFSNPLPCSGKLKYHGINPIASLTWAKVSFCVSVSKKSDFGFHNFFSIKSCKLFAFAWNFSAKALSSFIAAILAIATAFPYI